MDEARAMLRRLRRIDELEQRLLHEVRALVDDGDRWLAAEGDGAEAAAEALRRCRAILERRCM
jgi:hypothetical protein